MNKVKVQKEVVAERLFNVFIYEINGDDTRIKSLRDVRLSIARAITNIYEERVNRLDKTEYNIEIVYANYSYSNTILARSSFRLGKWTHTIYL